MTALVLALLAQGDPRLAAKVDLRLEIVPVAEAVAALGKAAHLELSASDSLQDLKATVLVDGMPAGRVMARLADVLRVAWQPEGGGYRLVKDPDAAAREAAYLEAERNAALDEVREGFRDMMAVGALAYAEIPEAQKEAQQALSKLKEGDPGYQAALDRRDALNQYGDLDGWMQGRLLTSLGEAGRARLLAGEPLAASTAAGEGGAALPPAAVGYPRNPQLPTNPSDKAQRIDLFLRVDPDTGTMLMRHDRMFQGGGEMSHPSWDNLADDVPDRLAKTPFGKELAAWNTEPLAGPLAERRCDPKTPQRPSEWWSGYHSETDALEWLHDASGVPVVAMASRRVHRITDLRFDGTVADYVKRWRAQAGGPTFRVADGFLMSRPGGFWHRRLTEIPEALLRPLEAKPTPSIDDYAAVAARITDRQAALVGEATRTVLRVCPYPLDDGVSALRLWAALTPAQRQTLRSEGAISYPQLGDAARAAFEAAAHDVFTGGWHEGLTAANFVGGPTGQGVWSLYGRTKNVSATGRSRPLPQDDPNHSWTQADQEPINAGILLALGTSYEDSIRFTLPLAGLPRRR